jgi:transcription-repair coupling factor (superfamily II helicase)
LVVSVVIGKLPNRQWLNHLNAFIKACVAETDGTDGK